MAATIHVVRKDNIVEHKSFPLKYTGLPDLEDGCIRARTAIASLTSNNLSYAHMGTALHWWDAFPVPKELPAPYNDRSQYGVVPVWGYAEVLESRVAGIDAGRLMWGFWPSHDLAIVLQLQKATGEGHFMDITPSRAKMMNLYHRCELAPPHLNIRTINQAQLETLAWETVGITTGAGWSISSYVLGDLAIHPFGRNGSEPWTTEDADLSNAVVISLSASSKTARGFTNAVVHDRKPGTTPLGLLAITGSPDPELIPKASFANKVIGYDDVQSKETLTWIQSLSPSRIIILDFGARGEALPDLTASLSTLPIKTTIIGIGNEMKVLSPLEKASLREKNAAIPNRIQMNTSDVYDEAMKLLGEKQFFEEKRAGWESFVRNGGLRGLRLEWREGVEGIEEGWEMLCEQKVGSDVCMVFRLG